MGPDRRGAGPSPCRRRSVRIFVADTRMPSLASSPRILMQPHRGFSRPSLRIRRRVDSSSGGRPPRSRLLGYVHFLRISSRCHRRSVCGLTMKEDQRGRGKARLAAARRTRSHRRRRRRPTGSPQTEPAESGDIPVGESAPTQSRLPPWKTPGQRPDLNGCTLYVGPAFQMSTAQLHSPSGSRRQMVTPRPGIVVGVPSGPSIVTAFSPNM